MTDLSFLKNFKITDFQCRCEACADDPSRPYTKIEVMRAVQALRDSLGKPLVVDRGVSCQAHNKAVGGAGDSRHLPQHADAVDLAVSDAAQAYLVVIHAMATALWTAFEVTAGHVHLDARPGPRIFLGHPS